MRQHNRLWLYIVLQGIRSVCKQTQYSKQSCHLKKGPHWIIGETLVQIYDLRYVVLILRAILLATQNDTS